MTTKNTKLPTKGTAVYVRKSKKHGQFSISNQMQVIRKYAKRRGLEIEISIRTGKQLTER